jgi:hypothetical protein
MSSDWARFVAEGDPNAWKGRKRTGVPAWPAYNTNEAKDFVYDANATSYLENDTWRAQGINLINRGSLDVLDHLVKLTKNTIHKLLLLIVCSQ